MLFISLKSISCTSVGFGKLVSFAQPSSSMNFIANGTLTRSKKSMNDLQCNWFLIHLIMIPFYCWCSSFCHNVTNIQTEYLPSEEMAMNRDGSEVAIRAKNSGKQFETERKWKEKALWSNINDYYSIFLVLISL